MPERPPHACSCGRPRQVVTALRSGTTWLKCSHCDRPCHRKRDEGATCVHCHDYFHAGIK